MPKACVTKYSVLGSEEMGGNTVTRLESVLGSEEMGGNTVTRLELESVSGRTHQLNVHCAAMGNPIVNDAVYGVDGSAAKNGGVEGVDGVSEDVQREINASASGGMCVHMKELSFTHPVTLKEMKFESKSPF